MAACGGIEHIFEKPLSEAPTFLESLSPWKHIKSLKPNIEDSSLTEIFGELHFKENHVHEPPSTSSSADAGGEEREKGYYDPSSERKQYRHRQSFSSDSLSLCTEGLGFESCDDVEEVSNDKDQCQQGDGDGERNLARNSHSDQGHRSEAAARTSRAAFPPPISCIGRSGKPWVCFKSYREDGRFILKEIRIPTQEFLHACRHDGRLKLHFVHSDDDQAVEEVEDEDVEEHDQEKTLQLAE